MFVRAVVIDDQMHMEPLRHAGIEVAQKAQELLMAMAGFALSDDPTIGDVERGKRSGRPMPLVVVADAFHVAQAKGQDGLGAFQGCTWLARRRPPFHLHSRPRTARGSTKSNAGSL